MKSYIADISAVCHESQVNVTQWSECMVGVVCCGKCFQTVPDHFTRRSVMRSEVTHRWGFNLTFSNSKHCREPQVVFSGEHVSLITFTVIIFCPLGRGN